VIPSPDALIARLETPESRRLFDALSNAGIEARFVGGCVRDALLGRPFADVDVAVDAPPENVARALEATGIRVIPTGIAHGTVTALLPPARFEITSLRRDVETDGRHAIVAFTDDWREDAARRDFTMNALSTDRGGRVFDYFGGAADALAGRVRFVGDPARRLEEDALRLLRFFRFHARLGVGEPDGEALAACAAAAPRLPRLSGERVRDEALRLLVTLRPALVWRMMLDRGIVDHLPFVARNWERLDRLTFIERAIGADPDALVRLAALSPRDRASATRTAEALRLSNADRDRLVALAEPPITLTLDGDGARRTRARVRDERLYRNLIRLAATDAEGPAVATRLLALPIDEPGPAFPLTGGDLIGSHILKPGPRLGVLLRLVEEWWIADGARADRGTCLARASEISGPPPASPGSRRSPSDPTR